MFAEIRRHITDAQGAQGITIVAVRCSDNMACRMTLGPLEMARVYSLRIVASPVIHAEQDAAVRFGKIGIELESLIETGDGLVMVCPVLSVHCRC